MAGKFFHLHLVSDATGETVNMVARSSLVQFKNIKYTEHVWNLIRNKNQIQKIIKEVQKNPGFVLYTLVDVEMTRLLENCCYNLKIPCIPVLNPVVSALSSYLDAKIQFRRGRQHVMDDEYFSKIEALHFVLNHDDGQSIHTLDSADVIVVGVSRTSKTPTCIYLANKDIKAANVPIVLSSELLAELILARKPLVVGLTIDPRQLVQVRQNRLMSLGQVQETNYTDMEIVTREVREANVLFESQSWPKIDVTRRSIEEVAANIIWLYNQRREQIF
jgi:regulator of PEP synthase PpsR (kinase-PPPase family)